MKKILNLKFGFTVRISEYKNIFAKGYVPKKWSEEVFIITKVKNTVPLTYIFSNLKGEEIVGKFYKKKLQKTNQKKFRVERIIKIKSNKQYVKWKGYDNSFNSWIDNKDILWRSGCFPEPKSFQRKVNVELDLPNYATKAYLKNAIGYIKIC